MPAGKYRQNLYKLGSGIFQRLLTHKQERTRTDHLHTFLNCSRDNVRERLLVHILRRKLYPNRVAKKKPLQPLDRPNSYQSPHSMSRVNPPPRLRTREGNLAKPIINDYRIAALTTKVLLQPCNEYTQALDRNPPG